MKSKGYQIKFIGDVFKGYSTYKLTSSRKDNDNSQELKMIGWKQLQDLVHNNKTPNNLKTMSISKIYNKDIKYVAKGDIVLPVISTGEQIDILYIDREPEEMYIYNETMLVIRITDLDVDSRYIYIMCNSAPIQNALVCLRDKSGLSFTRLTKEILMNILIAKSTLEERTKIVEEYMRINREKNEFSNKIDELQKSLSKETAVIWCNDKNK